MNFPWADELAVDVGTATIHVYVKNAGVVVREPAVIAYGEGRRRPLAFGMEAKRMLERAVEGVRVIRPIREGAIADFDAAASLLRHFLHRALGHRPMLNPVVVTACPTAATAVEHRALHDALRVAGAGRVLIVPKAMAAAIGAGLPLDSVETDLIVDMGAGSTDMGALSMGLLSAGASPALAGDRIDEAIVRHVKRVQGIRISQITAEEIKCQIGTVDRAHGNGNGNGLSISGDDLQAYDVDVDEVPAVVGRSLAPLYDEIAWLIEQLPPKARAEIGAHGITLAGGTALLRGLPENMADWLGVPVRLATDPMSCTILGLQSILNDLGALSLDGRRFSYPSNNAAS